MNFVQNLRRTLRALGRRPSFTLAAVLSIALGIGANTATFLFIEALLLRPVPVPRPSELVVLFTSNASSRFLYTSHLNFRDYREALPMFSGMAASVRTKAAISGGDHPVQVAAELVTGNYFELLELKPAVGHFPEVPSDQALGGTPYVVLGHDFWKRHFGGDPAVVGSTLQLNGFPFTVVGVAPPGFQGLNTLSPRDLWAPISMRNQLLSGPLASMFDLRRGLLLNVFGRLRPGTSVDEAEAAVRTVAMRLAQEYPDDNKDRSAVLVPLLQATINPEVRDRYVLAGRFLSIIVGLVLVIACVNVANLLLVRGLSRQRDIAIQLAVGSTRTRLIREVLSESLLLSFLGGLAGLGVAVLLRDVLWAFRPPRLPEGLDIGLDASSVGFAILLALLSGLLIGLIPAWRTTRPNLLTTLKEQAASIAEGRGRGLALRKGLVMGQVALSVIALVGAGLFVRSFQQAVRMDLGYNTDRLVVTSFDLGLAGYDDVRLRSFYQQALERIEAIPGISSAAWAEHLALAGGSLMRTVYFPGHEQTAGEDGVLIQSNPVSSSYFWTLGMKILQGRSFTLADRDGAARVAIVNQALAERFWPGEEAVGQKIRLFGVDDDYRVVGVAQNASYNTPGEEPGPYIYLPIDQNTASSVSLQARVAGDSTAVIPQVRAVLRDLDPNLPLADVRSMSEVVRQALWVPWTCAALLTIFGLLSTMLAAVGVYGVMAYSVNQRRQEIGIRMALGASGQRVRHLILIEGMRLVLVGIFAGLVGGFLGGLSVEALLFGMSPADPWTLLGSAILLTVVGFFANFLPALRASRQLPLQALRQR
jgi:macrolide transport system ATP-binding/permease protein